MVSIVSLFGLSSAQDEERRLSLLNTFTSGIIERVLDTKRAGEVVDNKERSFFTNQFSSQQISPTKLNLLGLQGANKVQQFKKKVQETIKPTQYLKFPRISSAIEKFKLPSKPQSSPVIPQIAPHYQQNPQYFNHFQAPALPYF